MKTQRIIMLLFILTVLSWGTVTFGTKNMMNVRERFFGVNPLGLDLYMGVFLPTTEVLQGIDTYAKYYYNYGPGILTALPGVLFALGIGHCPMTDGIPCFFPFYVSVIAVAILGYCLLILFLIHRTPHARAQLLLLPLTFIIGVPGVLGLERGNIDIHISLLIAAIWILLLNTKKEKRLAREMSAGALMGLCIATKLFLAPYSIVLLMGTKNKIRAIGTAFSVYLLFSYVPLFWHQSTSPTMQVAQGLLFQKSIPFWNPGFLAFNHSLAATASVFTPCFLLKTCTEQTWATINPIQVLLGMSVLLAPGLLGIQYLRKKQRWFSPQTNTQRVFALLFIGILATATINLIPLYAISYRLYFSVPFLLFLLAYGNTRPKVQREVLISIVFLLAKGIWLFGDPKMLGQGLFDPRMANFFVLGHFAFALRAALIGWIDAEKEYQTEVV